MKDLKPFFPATEKYTYLNTPATGLIPEPVVEWRCQQDHDFNNDPVPFLAANKNNLDLIRETLANHFGGKSFEMALIPNFSFGLNTVLEGLNSNEKVLLLNDEYPSINWPVESRGFEVFYADINEHLEENIYDSIQKNNISVFLFSVVQWMNGIKIDLEFVKQLKRDFPDLLLIADGTQYLGTEEFNFDESKIDILATSAYKWMTAGFGNGFIMVREAARQRFSPKVIGFASSPNFQDKPDETHFMKYFEPGHINSLNMGTMVKSIEFMQSLGIENCYQKIADLSAKAKAIFTEMDLLESSVVNRKIHSNIFNVKGDQAVFDKLMNHQIICIPRGEGIRVGFHYYNDENDLDRLVEILNS